MDWRRREQPWYWPSSAGIFRSHLKEGMRNTLSTYVPLGLSCLCQITRKHSLLLVRINQMATDDLHRWYHSEILGMVVALWYHNCGKYHRLFISVYLIVHFKHKLWGKKITWDILISKLFANSIKQALVLLHQMQRKLSDTHAWLNMMSATNLGKENVSVRNNTSKRRHGLWHHHKNFVLYHWYS